MTEIESTPIPSPALSAPSPNGPQTGRGPDGKFRKGCRPGPGNPYAAEVGKRRAKLLKEIKNKDVSLAVKVMRDVMTSGKDSDKLTAARMLLDRALGPIVEVDLISRLKELEEQLTRSPDGSRPGT
jgi:hypothetical protein